MNLNLLRAARVARGLRAIEVAEHLEMKPDLYYRKERGATKFSIDEFREIAIFLQLSVSEINNILFNGQYVPFGI